MRAVIRGTGSCVPDRKITNADLEKLKPVKLDLATVQTNILYFSVPGREGEFDAWMERLKEKQVLALYLATRWRMVTHNDVDGEDVERALAAWKDILG